MAAAEKQQIVDSTQKVVLLKTLLIIYPKMINKT